MATRDPVATWQTLRAADLLDLLGHQLLEHAKPHADAQREQSLFRCSDELPQRFLHARRQRLLGRLDASFDLPARYGLHAVLLSRAGASTPANLVLNAPHAANGSGRGRENRHFKFYAERDILRMTPWPQLGLELFNRGTRRAHALAVSLAIAHHQRVDDRLLLTLWHLAERWGRVLPDGIVVPLPLSHQRLADLIGAHRPAVTSALGALQQQGQISRRDDRTWLLHGSPPEELRHHRLAATMT